MTPGGAVGIRQTDDGTVGFAGLASCGRIWLCPVCNAKVMARRALDLGLMVTWAAAHEYALIWGSLTAHHTARDPLAPMLDMQASAWRSVVSSRSWRNASTTTTVAHAHDGCDPECDRKRDIVDVPLMHGRVGYVRAAELTTGVNGWHPHYHPLIVWRGDRDYARWYADQVVGQWLDGVSDAGGFALADGAQQLRVLEPEEYTAELSGYVTKATYDGSAMALEVAWSQGKNGNGRAWQESAPNESARRRAPGTQAHWTILRRLAIDSGELTDDLERWWELEAATHGHRMLTWSRGLRDFVGLGVESTDEEEAAREVGTAEDTVCFITDSGWAHIRDTPAAVAGILSSLETGGWPALRAHLEAWGVEYSTEPLRPTFSTEGAPYSGPR